MPSHTPRCILIRHGQTAWSKTGQYTSHTDLSLTPFGVKQMEITGKYLVSKDGYTLIHSDDVKLIITSPRKRAIETRDLVFKGYDLKSEIDEDIREWEYGDYEGLLTKEIIELRKSRGLGEDWNIWEYGCENGEDSEDVRKRIDRLIAKIRAIHKEYMDRNESCDVVVVAHGHILRCFAARWIDIPISRNPKFMLDAGGVCVLSYQHHNLDEPAMFLTGAFTVPVDEEGKGI